jgi:hypothetical protein
MERLRNTKEMGRPEIARMSTFRGRAMPVPWSRATAGALAPPRSVETGAPLLSQVMIVDERLRVTSLRRFKKVFFRAGTSNAERRR